MITALGMECLRSAKTTPWQNCLVERASGSIWRDCTDHIFPRGEKQLMKPLTEYAHDYNEDRTHSSQDASSPAGREGDAACNVVARPVLGGLHHRYSRAAWRLRECALDGNGEGARPFR